MIDWSDDNVNWGKPGHNVHVPEGPNDPFGEPESRDG